ncbi:MAG: hypothetical protein GY823_13470, partial [Flavobacteriaceae bacterium]|nr:hypothetical protein [Flavobacteriaceae bacterium]
DVNVVHEQGLRSATDTDTSNVVSDTFSINSTDAISSALVGTGANQKELVGFDFTSGTVDVTTTNGTISITNYDAGTGIVSYTYTVDANQTHADADGNNEITDAIALQVTDSDGDVGNGTLNIKIIDDVPTAANDTASTAEDTPVTVNVVANDEQGADTAVITAASVDAAQGTVTFNAATGEVTFNPKDGFEGDATISYTITDTDGDPSTATLKVTVAPDGVPTITPKPPVTGTDPDAPDVDDVNVVHEQGLRSATDTDTSNVVSDTFSINSTDAISSALVGTGANQK